MKTKTTTLYRVSDQDSGSHYSEDGYSKYIDRWRAKHNGTLPDDEDVYGYWQAVAHAMELKARNAHLKLEIKIQTIVETCIPL